MGERSLVLELQDMAQSGTTDVSELVRRAKVVASKLQLQDVVGWLDHELDGYPSTDAVPKYRIVAVQLMAKNPYHGAIPVLIENGKLAKSLSSRSLPMSIGHLASLIAGKKSGRLEIPVPGPLQARLSAGQHPLERLPMFWCLGTNEVEGVLHAVRNRILNWSLELERAGVLGEGMSFSKEEKAAASNVTINNYGSMVHGDNANVANVDASPGANVAVASGGSIVEQRLQRAVAKARRDAPDVAASIDNLALAIGKTTTLSQEEKDGAVEQLAFVAEQAALPEAARQTAILRPTVGALKESLSVSADLLQVWSAFGPPLMALFGLMPR